MQEGTTYVGLDAHQASTNGAILLASGEVLEDRFATTLEGIRRWVRRLKPALFMIPRREGTGSAQDWRPSDRRGPKAWRGRSSLAFCTPKAQRSDGGGSPAGPLASQP